MCNARYVVTVCTNGCHFTEFRTRPVLLLSAIIDLCICSYPAQGVPVRALRHLLHDLQQQLPAPRQDRARQERRRLQVPEVHLQVNYSIPLTKDVR